MEQNKHSRKTFDLHYPSPSVGQRSVINETAANIYDCEPTLDFEVTRRQVETNLRDAWFFFSDLQKQLHLNKGKMSQEEFNKNQNEGAERIRVLQYDLWRLSQMGGKKGSWREREATELSEEIQRRLYRLQHPPDCTTAKKLLCDLDTPCGLGCQFHHLIHCFMAAYETHRTLVLNSTGWRYSPKGWETVFQPFSETCTNYSKANITYWPGKNDSPTIRFPPSYIMNPSPNMLPLAIPRDISKRLLRLHGNPGVWWMGQFIKYFFKFQPNMQETISKTEKSIQFEHPIVGVHVRRTDKRTETSYHNVEEYMEQVEEYFAGLQLLDPNVTRRIYLSSDEPKVYEEMEKKYPHYKILYHRKHVQVDQDITRFTVTSLRDLVVDIYFLARTDYIVVTFTSNIGRLVYEMMQTLNHDASAKFYSLDKGFYSHSQRPNFSRVRFTHQARRYE
ncbi:alpha-(1,6)-fucosyltransferase-like [Cherax quadricarinatus]|uniref:alpha-(1,6)-fucosyltransferase-like n=1 Tax=Cherax quadricarinatus TaxID=27406 RepID=UPI00387E788E